jgi:hypothetical protein
MTSIKDLTINNDNPFPVQPGNWHLNDVTQGANAPLAYSGPGGYMFTSQTDFGSGVQSTQQVAYRDVAKTVQLLVWQDPNWVYSNITIVSPTQPTSPPSAAGAPGGFAFDIGNTQNVFYRDASGNIWLLSWNEVDYWTNVNLTKATNAPSAAGDPVGYAFDAQGTQHIMYRDVNGNIQELWWDGVWNNDNVTGQTNAPLAAGDPHCYMFKSQGTQHVVYIDTERHIQELWWGGAWNNDDLTIQTSAPLSAGDPFGYVFEFQGTQHVIYRDENGHLQELLWDGAWQYDPNNNDLTNATGAPLAQLGIIRSLTAHAYEARGTQHVIYRDVNEHIQEIVWNNGGWSWSAPNNDLTAITNAPMAATPGGLSSYVFSAQDTRHVFYLDVNEHIQEFWWDSNSISVA